MKPNSKTKSAPKTVDEYLAKLSDDKRAALERLRKTIRTIVPRAEECISYQMPAFRIDGRVAVWFGAGTNHCALYPGAIPKAFAAELEGYETSKGTIRFKPDKPLPTALVRKLIRARMAKNAAPKKAASRRAKTARP